MKRRLIALFLTLGLGLALAACDSLPDEVQNNDVPSGTTSADASGSAGGADDGVVLPDSDGYADGFMGDTMRTAFFDFTVNSAYTCSEYESYVPSEGHMLLVAEVTFYNPTTASTPMYDTDLQAQWSGEGDADFALAVTCPRSEVGDTDAYPNTGIDPVGDMFPTEFDLAIQESRTGLLVFEVPAGEKDFSLSYQELYNDNSTGDTFFVYFTPEVK